MEGIGEETYRHEARENSPFNVEIRGNGTEVFNEPYSEKAVRRLKKLVLNFYYQGERKYYSIHVDGEKVVERTSDGRKFNRYLQFVEKETRVVEVRLYKGESFNCNRYLFIISKGLNGVGKQEEMEEQIKQALEAQEKENELIYLRAELEKKERKIKKLKKLTAQKEEGISLGAVKEFLIEGKGLVDAFRGTPAPTQLGGTEPESEVTIEAESPDPAKAIYDQLYEQVGQEGIMKALNIMGTLSQHPELEEILIKELNKKQAENGEA